MRPKVLEISWHETQAVYACDFQPLPAATLKKLLPTSTDEEDPSSTSAAPATSNASGSTPSSASMTSTKKDDKSITPVRSYRLATAGGDSKVRLWMIHPNIPPASASTHTAITGQEIAPHPPRAEYLATLSKHTAAVNVVRFSPNGQVLASAGDDGNVILWVPSDRPVATFGESSDDVQDKEHWRLQKLLQVTTKHVYDLAWSPDGEFFIAGSTDNTATIWKASTGECVFALREHSHNVQGVSWDPLNEFIATQSSDRSVHVNTFAFRNGVPDVHPVSRANRMEIRHSRTPSIPREHRPSLARRGSTTSETGSVITSVSEVPDLPLPPAIIGAPMTPSASVPSTPQGSAMNPPASTKPSSRRSSFSGSQAAGSPALSAAVFPHRGRSPSPIPPLPAVRPPSTQSIIQKLYGDESVTRFFRRLTFSPDGSLLMTPAGQIEDQLFKGSPLLSTRSLSQDGTAPANMDVPPSLLPASATTGGTNRPKNIDAGRPTVYIYSRANLSRAPIAHLPGHKTASVAIRFSPIFYDLRTGPIGPQPDPKQITLDRMEEGPVHVSLSMPPPPRPITNTKDTKDKDTPTPSASTSQNTPLASVFALPYRLLYAVACQDSVLLYDTQQAGPVAIFRGLHYAGFTDVAWSPDGQALMLSSADGYCSIVVFDMSELGTVHPTQQHHRQLAAIAQSHNHPTPSASSHRDSFSSNQGTTSGSAIHGLHRDRESISSATPIPPSPAFSTSMRQSPAPGGGFSTRSEREGSTSSSVLGGPTQRETLPLFNPYPHGGGSNSNYAGTSGSTTSSEMILPTPGEEIEGFTFGTATAMSGGMRGRSTSASSSSQLHGLQGNAGLGLGSTDELKRRDTTSGGEGEGERGEGGTPPGGVKKKRRIALTHLGDGA